MALRGGAAVQSLLPLDWQRGSLDVDVVTDIPPLAAGDLVHWLRACAVALPAEGEGEGPPGQDALRSQASAWLQSARTEPWLQSEADQYVLLGLLERYAPGPALWLLGLLPVEVIREGGLQPLERQGRDLLAEPGALEELTRRARAAPPWWMCPAIHRIRPAALAPTDTGLARHGQPSPAPPGIPGPGAPQGRLTPSRPPRSGSGSALGVPCGLRAECIPPRDGKRRDAAQPPREAGAAPTQPCTDLGAGGGARRPRRKRHHRRPARWRPLRNDTAGRGRLPCRHR